MDETKACPFCAERILAAATKCRFCGEFLEGHRPPPIPSTPAKEPPKSPPKEGLFLQTMNVGCGIVLVLIVIIVIAFVAGGTR